MPNNNNVAFFAAITGAGVGGLASLAGSVFVQRRTVIRTARLRMFVDLLPELEGALDDVTASYSLGRLAGSSSAHPQRGVSQVLDELRRQGVVAGRRESKLAGGARSAWNAYTQPPIQEQGLDQTTGKLVPELPGDSQREFHAVVRKLDEHLKRKLDRLV